MRRTVDQSIRVGQVDQYIAFAVNHAHHAQFFEHQGNALAEHFLLWRQVLAGKRNRADLAAGDRRLGLVFRQTEGALDTAGLGARHIAGHAIDLGVVIGFDHYLVIGADQDEGRGYFTDLIGTHARDERQRQEDGREFFHRILSIWRLWFGTPA